MAGVHLAVAGALILWMEARDEKYRESGKIYSATSQQQAVVQGGEAVSFDLCGMIVDYSIQEKIIGLANFPAVNLTGWHLFCPPAWTVAGMLHIKFYSYKPTTERQVDFGLLLLISIQWFLIGGFPLIKPKRWWWEPGAFITLCTVIAFILVLIPWIYVLSGLPMLCAMLAWLYWFGLLVWKMLRGGWWLTKLAIRRG